MAVKNFIERKINSNTWVIEGMGCYSYLVLGNERALMVDTGMSQENIHDFVKGITDLPITVVNTHGHFDHTGGDGWFNEAYMTEYAATEARNTLGMISIEQFPPNYNPKYNIQVISEGHIFDLGGRTLEVITIPAHNPGSIALLDKENRILFSGDEIEAGQVLLMLETSISVESHQDNMKKLKERMHEFDYIFPGHNGTPIHNSYIDTFIENDQRIMDGIEGIKDIHSPSLPVEIFPDDENYRRSEYKGSSIIYDMRKIFNK